MPFFAFFGSLCHFSASYGYYATEGKCHQSQRNKSVTKGHFRTRNTLILIPLHLGQTTNRVYRAVRTTGGFRRRSSRTVVRSCSIGIQTWIGTVRTSRTAHHTRRTEAGGRSSNGVLLLRLVTLRHGRQRQRCHQDYYHQYLLHIVQVFTLYTVHLTSPRFRQHDIPYHRGG